MKERIMSRNVRNNDTTRPRKSGAAKNRRLLEHRRRLVALGVPEEGFADGSSADRKLIAAVFD